VSRGVRRNALVKASERHPNGRLEVFGVNDGLFAFRPERNDKFAVMSAPRDELPHVDDIPAATVCGPGFAIPATAQRETVRSIRKAVQFVKACATGELASNWSRLMPVRFSDVETNEITTPPGVVFEAPVISKPA
jgi:hypothetical protein